jgi:tRNA1(Val) A37 N6-methylase TrmN6
MKPFQFKHFSVQQSNAALKVGTDAMLLGALCAWENPQHLLDIGTGTGVLSLMAAQRFPFQTITAIDISEQAILDAQVTFTVRHFLLLLPHFKLRFKISFVSNNTTQLFAIHPILKTVPKTNRKSLF